jgi:hypothetical protein
VTIEGIAAEAGIEGEEAEVRMEVFVGAGHHVSGEELERGTGSASSRIPRYIDGSI